MEWFIHFNQTFKLGLVKQFVKALDFGGETFQEIRLMFPKLSEAKIKGGIFVGPQVKAMLKSEKLERAMTKVEKEAWCAFRDVVCEFLGNYKDPNYKQLVAKLIENFKKLGCRMSLKIYEHKCPCWKWALVIRNDINP